MLLHKLIKAKKKEAKILRIKAYSIDQEIRVLEDKRKKVCKHLKTKIVINSYEEPGRVKYSEWKEKICTSCGKVVATAEETISVKWKDTK